MTKVAVLADIHGNSAALDAILADIERRGITEVLNLGDSVCGPLDPVGTADRLMARDFLTIAGNHDRWLLDRPAEEQPLWEQWTLPLLSEAHLNWLRDLPPTRVVGDILMTHGTPGSDTQDWLHVRAEWGTMRQAKLNEILSHIGVADYPVILSGHTHFPRIVRLPDTRLLVNPGAAGCPAYLDDRTDPPFVAETGAPDARYAVLEKVDHRWQAELVAVPYDPSEMIARALSHGAASWAEALHTGWVHPDGMPN